MADARTTALDRFRRRPLAERLFAGACGLIVLALVLVLEWRLPFEFFKTDDFVFLSNVQDPAWSWAHTYFPVGTWSYWNVRPLGVDSYFRIGWQLFGMDPAGYFQINILCQLALAPVVYRLARQLGIASPVALAATVFCLSRPPSLFVVFFGSGFSSSLAQLLVAGSLTLYIDHARGRGRHRLAGSLAALFLALLSHDNVFMLPAVLVFASLYVRGWSPPGRALVRAVRDALPHAVMIATYLFVRFTWIAPLRDDGPYARNYAPEHVLKHYWLQLRMLGEQGGQLGLSILLIGALLAFALRSAEGRHDWTTRALPATLLCGVWIGGFLAPLTLVPNAHVRFSQHVEVPVALLVATFVQLAFARLRARAVPAFLAALCALLVIAVPWRSLVERRDDPGWSFPRRFLETVARAHPDLPERARFVLVYGDEGLAGRRRANRFRSRTLGGPPLVRAAWYAKQPDLRFLDAATAARPVMLCDTCIYLDLLPDLGVAPIDAPAVARRILAPALASGHASARAAAARQLARRLGADAVPLLAAACRTAPASDACADRLEQAVRHSGAPDAARLAAALRRAEGEAH